MNLEDKREFYNSFFRGSAPGRELIEQMEAVELANIRGAQDKNSLDYLSRSKGNREIIDLIQNVLRTDGKGDKE